MANHNNNNSSAQTAVDNIQALIDAQKDVQKNKNWKQSELSKAKAELKKELDVIDNACRATVKQISDPILKKQTEILFEQKKLEMKAQHAPKIERLKIDVEAIAEAGSVVAGEKVGEIIAPLTKAGVGFFGTLAKRAGLKK